MHYEHGWYRAMSDNSYLIFSENSIIPRKGWLEVRGSELYDYLELNL